MFSGKSLTKI